MTVLAERIGHEFADPRLLYRAMAHRSWCAEHPGNESNERLEFLGDAVLGWLIADRAFRAAPAVPEGRLTDARKALVNADTLAVVARELGIGQHIRLGRGEALAGGADKRSILADALEAVIGAVYLDGGVGAAGELITRLFGHRLDHNLAGLDGGDHKTQLQELTARRFDAAPTYQLTSTGPDHAKVFEAVVHVAGRRLGSGIGPSKKSAEQAAAQQSLQVIAADA